MIGISRRLVFKTIKTPQGFTLAELIVSIFVITILFSFVLANIRGAGSNDITPATQDILTDIRQVQTMALAGAVIDVCVDENNIQLAVCNPSCTNCVQDVSAGGYGFATLRCDSSPCAYVLTADVNQDGTPTSGLSELLPGFPKNVAGKNFISQIYYSDLANPPEPFTGWQAVPNGFVAVTYHGDQVTVNTNSTLDDSTIRWVGLLIGSEKTTLQRYILISASSSLISNGNIQ